MRERVQYRILQVPLKSAPPSKRSPASGGRKWLTLFSRVNRNCRRDQESRVSTQQAGVPAPRKRAHPKFHDVRSSELVVSRPVTQRGRAGGTACPTCEALAIERNGSAHFPRANRNCGRHQESRVSTQQAGVPAPRKRAHPKFHDVRSSELVTEPRPPGSGFAVTSRSFATEGKWAEAFLSMARASQVGQAVLACPPALN